MSRTLRQRLAVVLMAVVAVGAVGTAPVLAQVSGAIFTTDHKCDGTDLNLYTNKKAVYLDGGPRKPGSAGLPDGEYYVKVTEPNGTLLGTTVGHPVDETPVVVVGGEFVTCYQLWDILIKASDGTKGYDDTSNNGGEYKVWASQNRDFPNSESKTDNFKVKNGKPVEQTEIRARKFYDADADGVWDPGEPPIPDWHIELQLLDHTVIACGLTDGGGEVRFLVDLDGMDYLVVETMVEPYVNSTPIEVHVIADAPIVEVEFGNYCIVERFGLGRTPGFWQSCNNPNGTGIVGCDLLAACDPDWRELLNALCLVWPDGSNLVIPGGDFWAAFAELDGWITGTGAEGNMAYILSRQVAALALNRTCGFMTAAVVLAEDPDGNIIPVDDLIAAADALLCAYPLTLGSDSDPDVVAARAEQERYKNTIDAINNNILPVYTVSPTPCPFTPVPCP